MRKSTIVMVAFAVVFGLLAVFIAQAWLNGQAERRLRSLEAQKKPLSPQVPAKEADVRGQMPEASTPAPVPVPLPVFDAKLGPIAPH
mgnify:CR=1 FL=1